MMRTEEEISNFRKTCGATLHTSELLTDRFPGIDQRQIGGEWITVVKSEILPEFHNVYDNIVFFGLTVSLQLDGGIRRLIWWCILSQTVSGKSFS